MTSVDLRKIYRFSPVEPLLGSEALPSGSDLYYECMECNAVVNSVPFIKSVCACGNLAGAAGKMTIKYPERVRVMRGKLK